MTAASIDDPGASGSVKSSYFDAWFRKKLFNMLEDIPFGNLVIEEDGQCFSFGSSDSSLHATISVKHGSFYRSISLGGSIGAAEAYMAAVWSSPDLVSVVRLMSANIDWFNRLDDSKLPVQWLSNKMYYWTNRNTELGSKENISAHYDLSNDFFSLFLDRSMMYSSAIFKNTTDSLEHAAEYKLDRVCEKLNLTSSDHLLEIGTGWGGLAVHAAKKYGCSVTTATISQQQYDFAVQRVREEGLEGCVEVLLEDYRNLNGQYDKLVSIEMIEAVGHEYYDTYFSCCSKLLKPDGHMLIQAITIPDQRYQQAKKSVDFIQRYIFPGGCLPSHRVIADSVGRCTDMQITGMQEIGLDYALTLNHWKERFHSKLDEVKALGFDDSFIRMWEYYFSYCEGAFSERIIGTSQIVFAKPAWRDPAKCSQDKA